MEHSMTREAVIGRIVACIARCDTTLNVEVTAKTSLVKDLGFDSIDMLDVTMELEDEFDCVIANSVIEKADTVDAIATYVIDTVINR